MNSANENSEIWGITKALVAWLGAVLLILGLAAGGYRLAEASWSPKVNDLTTKGIEHSYTYVQTKKDLIVHLVQEYRRLETQQVEHRDDAEWVGALEAQKTATRDRIRQEAASIPTEEIPREALPLLGAP